MGAVSSGEREYYRSLVKRMEVYNMNKYGKLNGAMKTKICLECAERIKVENTDLTDETLEIDFSEEDLL